MSMQEHYDQNTNQKLRAKKGHYRLNSLAIFRPKIYGLRSNVEGVFSVIKRLFNGTNRSRTFTISHTKKLNLKTQSTTSTDQHKSTKNEGFYKAFF